MYCSPTTYMRIKQYWVLTCIIKYARLFIVADRDAGVAQLVEQLICNQQVAGSSPITSSTKNPLIIEISGFYVICQ